MGFLEMVGSFKFINPLIFGRFPIWLTKVVVHFLNFNTYLGKMSNLTGIFEISWSRHSCRINWSSPDVQQQYV